VGGQLRFEALDMTVLTGRPTNGDEEFDQAQQVMREAELVVGHEVAPRFARGDLRAADTALSTIRGALSKYVDVDPSAQCDAKRTLAALMLRAEHIQVTLKDAILAQHNDMTMGVQEAVERLRSVTSAAALVERVPVEAYRLGFNRILFSRIHEGTWLTCSAFAGDDEEIAATMVAVGQAHPRRLNGELLESDMVRRSAPMLVRNAQSNPRVHPELIAVTNSTSYVAAPMLTWGKPVGLLHADRHTDKHGVDEFDRHLIGVFAEGLGVVLERNIMIDRLQAMRRAADEHLRTANAIADDFSVEVMDLAGPAATSVENLLAGDPPARPSSIGHRPLSDLTSRELDVLRGLAAGRTNAQIALSLFVAEGTVKSHVKHILRKLGAANRTEAVAKYHRLFR
jgi:DNA-binding CsgD family transcriptional regulator